MVDARQGDHFKQLFETACRWGYDQIDLRHVSFGTILGDDRRPFKTRSGDTVGLESLIEESIARARRIVYENDGSKPQGPELDEQARSQIAEAVGVGAIKYADLAQNRTTDSVFSFDKMLELKGNTAAYMQYAVARVEGIFAKGGIERGPLRAATSRLRPAEPAERSLALHLLRFGEVLEDVEADYRPNLLTAWLYELAGRYSALYDSLPVLKAEGTERATRLALCDLTGRALRRGLRTTSGFAWCLTTLMPLNASTCSPGGVLSAARSTTASAVADPTARSIGFTPANTVPKGVSLIEPPLKGSRQVTRSGILSVVPACPSQTFSSAAAIEAGAFSKSVTDTGTSAVSREVGKSLGA